MGLFVELQDSESHHSSCDPTVVHLPTVPVPGCEENHLVWYFAFGYLYGLGGHLKSGH
jgi:hypothetical protein